MEFIDHSAPKSLAEKAYVDLIKRITKLEIEPGSVLAEKNLIVDLGIGRTPIREALQRLSIEGLVTHQLNRGMFVSPITYSDVQEIYEFRSLIDGFACRLAAHRASIQKADELMVCHGQLVDAFNAEDVDLYIQHDRKFHEIIGQSANNVFLAETIPRIYNLHLRLWFYIVSQQGNWNSVAKSHQVMTRTVAEAVAEKDSARAEQAMKDYIFQRQQDLFQEFAPSQS